MNTCEIQIAGEILCGRPSGALWWPDQATLVVSDMHLGKSERQARRNGALLPPYETRDTLARLGAEIDALEPDRVIALGDSFDDLWAAESLDTQDRATLDGLVARQNWIWIEGNHDPGATSHGGQTLEELRLGPLIYRHIAHPHPVTGEISGHYHPKHRLRARGRSVSRPCFLFDSARLILPAFGTYTGGLPTDAPAFAGLFEHQTWALLTGPTPVKLPCGERRTCHGTAV